eukprot:g3824.t1
MTHFASVLLCEKKQGFRWSFVLKFESLCEHRYKRAHIMARTWGQSAKDTTHKAGHAVVGAGKWAGHTTWQGGKWVAGKGYDGTMWVGHTTKKGIHNGSSWVARKTG